MKIIFNRVISSFQVPNRSYVINLLGCAPPYSCDFSATKPSINLVMDAIIDLHHDIMAFLVFISLLMVHMLLYVFDESNIKKHNKPVGLSRNTDTSLENIWMVSLVIVSTLVIVFSFSSFFLIEDNIAISPPVTVKFKVIDHRLYWTYESSPVVGKWGSLTQKTKIAGLPAYSVLLNEEGLLKKYNLLSIHRPLSLPAYSVIQLIINPSDVLFFISIPAFNITAEIYPDRLNVIKLDTDGPGVFYGQYSLETCFMYNKFTPFIVNIVRRKDFEILVLHETDELFNLYSAQKRIAEQNKKNKYCRYFFKINLKSFFYFNRFYFGSGRVRPVSDDSFLSPNFRPKGFKTPFQYHFPYHSDIYLDDNEVNSNTVEQSTNYLFFTTVTEQVGRLDQFMFGVQPQYREESKNNQYGIKPPEQTSWLQEINKKLIVASKNSNIKLQGDAYEAKQIKRS